MTQYEEPPKPTDKIIETKPSKYLNMSAEDKEAWIQDYIDRRLAEGFDEHGKRKRSDTGKVVSVGTKSLLRKRAKNKLADRIKEATSAPKTITNEIENKRKEIS